MTIVYTTVLTIVYTTVLTSVYTLVYYPHLLKDIRREKVMQAFKTWGENLISPLINPAKFDFWAQQLGTTHAWGRCFARVISIMSQSPDTKTLTLRRIVIGRDLLRASIVTSQLRLQDEILLGAIA